MSYKFLEPGWRYRVGSRTCHYDDWYGNQIMCSRYRAWPNPGFCGATAMVDRMSSYEELMDLARSIARYGQNHPIERDRTRGIFAGRNRYLAARIVGKPPLYRDHDFDSEDAIVRYVMIDATRKDATLKDKAFTGAALCEGGQRGRPRKNENGPAGPFSRLTIRDAAKEARSSESSIKRIKALKKLVCQTLARALWQSRELSDVEPTYQLAKKLGKLPVAAQEKAASMLNAGVSVADIEIALRPIESSGIREESVQGEALQDEPLATLVQEQRQRELIELDSCGEPTNTNQKSLDDELIETTAEGEPSKVVNDEAMESARDLSGRDEPTQDESAEGEPTSALTHDDAPLELLKDEPIESIQAALGKLGQGVRLPYRLKLYYLMLAAQKVVCEERSLRWTLESALTDVTKMLVEERSNGFSEELQNAALAAFAAQHALILLAFLLGDVAKAKTALEIRLRADGSQPCTEVAWQMMPHLHSLDEGDSSGARH